jgi:hypothetical protein
MKLCLKCRLYKQATDFHDHQGGKHPYCKSCRCVIAKKYADALRDNVFERYGGSHRKTDASVGKNLYRWLKRNKYPDGFQVLRMNCNLGKSRNNGICPHRSHIQVT